jgi:hypothetical protein
MKSTVISYQAKPEATQRNIQLIQDVFSELSAAAPDTVGYAVLRTEDGTFYHIVSYENDDNTALTKLPAFATFQAGGAACRATQPVFSDVTVVGNYRILPE